MVIDSKPYEDIGRWTIEAETNGLEWNGRRDRSTAWLIGAI